MDGDIIVTTDASQVTRALAELQESLVLGFASAFDATKASIRDTTRRRFLSSDGGQWTPVKDSTLKHRKVNPLNEPLIDSGDLMKSVTEPGAKDSAETQTPFTLELGTSRVDAMRHNFGSRDGREPARQFLDIDDAQQAEIEAIFLADLDSRISRL